MEPEVVIVPIKEPGMEDIPSTITIDYTEYLDLLLVASATITFLALELIM